jgi:pimeloyl-ACP methyl ester carboxylesterase
MTTFVLVPGAGGSSWDWHLVVPELRGLGHDVIAVDLPAGDDLAGLAAYADTVVQAIGERSDVVLVALSFGGFTAPLVCARADVRLLVLLNAMIPRPGETFTAWWGNTGQRAAQRAYAAELGLTADQIDDDAVLYYHDVPPDKAAEAEKLDLAQSATPLDEPWPLPSWPSVRTRVLSGADDRLFPAEFQQRVARDRLGLDADTIPGGHMVAISNPRVLAERLHAYATEEVGKGRVPS